MASVVEAAVQSDAGNEPTETIPCSEGKTVLPEIYRQNGDLAG